jgi:hypothetical protein
MKNVYTDLSPLDAAELHRLIGHDLARLRNGLGKVRWGALLHECIDKLALQRNRIRVWRALDCEFHGVVTQSGLDRIVDGLNGALREEPPAKETGTATGTPYFEPKRSRNNSDWCSSPSQVKAYIRDELDLLLPPAMASKDHRAILEHWEQSLAELLLVLKALRHLQWQTNGKVEAWQLETVCDDVRRRNISIARAALHCPSDC